MPHTSITLRPMTYDDISLGMSLKAKAGWNQLEANWRMFLDFGSDGYLVALYDEVPSGTVITIPYQDHFSWVGMVLVDPLKCVAAWGRRSSTL